MQTLRSVRVTARLVLMWFAVYLAAAVASPLIAPAGDETICSGAGMIKRLLKEPEGSSKTPTSQSAMDCPLCVPGGAPPPSPAMLAEIATAQPLAFVTLPVSAAPLVTLAAAPLPARGLPSAS